MQMNKISLLAWALAGSLSSAVILHAGGTFEDRFERPDSDDIGPGWSKDSGEWSLVEETVEVGDDASTNKLLTYTPIELVQHPFVASVDMAGLSDGRWGGLAFHVQPWAFGTFYSLIARVERTQNPNTSAIQFRRYEWGSSTVIASHILSADLTLGEFFRYTVVSREPGVFDLSVDSLDEDGNVADNLIRFRVMDPILEGGHVALHADSNRVAFDRFFVSSQALTEPVELSYHGAVELTYSAAPGRVARIQRSSDLIEWSDMTIADTIIHGPVSRVVSTRFTDREFYRVVPNL